MTHRILFPIDDLLGLVAGNPEQELAVRHALERLANDLNNILTPAYEASLIHLDTRNYLALTGAAVRREPTYEEAAAMDQLRGEKREQIDA